ncbi:MAG: helix-hairpin-helix domain-containing protein [Acidimicrobiales bacterium]|nr:helix-hairpin-helix domain-containing protein [Acidimicrobiales bacterium]
MAHPLSRSDSDHGPTSYDDDRDRLDHLRPITSPTWRDRFDDLVTILATSPLRAVAAVAVTATIAVAGWWLLKPPAAPPVEARIPLATRQGTATAASSPGTSAFPSSSPSEATTTVQPTSDLVVQAAGAVRSPGVYHLRAGARVDDLVGAAGGLSPDADTDRINLAALVSDGERVWLPRRGEIEVPEVVAGTGGGAAGSNSSATEPTGDEAQPVDLNTASAKDLEELPGVGPATANAIVAYRDTNGPFSSVDELLEVRGIGEAKLEQIRPMATVR